MFAPMGAESTWHLTLTDARTHTHTHTTHTHTHTHLLAPLPCIKLGSIPKLGMASYVFMCVCVCVCVCVSQGQNSAWSSKAMCPVTPEKGWQTSALLAGWSSLIMGTARPWPLEDRNWAGHSWAKKVCPRLGGSSYSRVPFSL